jgi:hypothetical protein
MFFNQTNIIIYLTILTFILYLILPPPIILIEKDKEPTCCYNCMKK